MGSTDNSAIMTIDLKWNRFRIHKSTLNKMGNPQYVQFLVNPEEMFIAVLGSDRPLAGGTSNRVKLVQTSRHYSIEFYSNTLLCALVNMIGTLDFQYSYRMSGEVDVANRVVEAPVIDEATRSDLLACINDCGNGISEMRLSMDAVRLLKSKGDAFATQIKIVWRDASAKYSDGSKGYLSMIGGLSSNPKRATELADNITKTVAGEPSIKAVKKLVADVSEAKKIADEFSLNPEIEVFLKKVSSLQATVADLTPDILTWLKGKNLTSKLKIRF